MRHVPKAIALHVLIGDFDDQLGTERLPRQIFALAPTALPAGHAMSGFSVYEFGFRPALPRMIGERVVAIGREKFYQLTALFGCEAGADTDVLECA